MFITFPNLLWFGWFQLNNFSADDKLAGLLDRSFPGRLLCVDNVQSRLERLQRSLACYGPVSSPELAIDVIHETQLSDYVRNQLVCGPNDSVQLFDKVLVDVPCSTDRHALCSHQGSLFSPGRAAARIGLPSTQSRLLRYVYNHPFLRFSHICLYVRFFNV